MAKAGVVGDTLASEQVSAGETKRGLRRARAAFDVLGVSPAVGSAIDGKV